MFTKRNLQGASAGIILLGLLTVVASAEPSQDGRGAGPGAPTGQEGGEPIVRPATRHDTSPPLRTIPPVAPQVDVLKQLPRFVLRDAGPPDDDPVVQSGRPSAEIPSASLTFEGISNVNGALPPDTDGDVGPNHYVQMVNLSFAVWDRSGNLLLGPMSNNTLWSGFGGPCQTTNDGDPIVLYDHLADRWLLSQFALPNYPVGPFYECIAISQTGDPTGVYHRYEFLISTTKMNDYPKFGVWPDAYYMAVNQFNENTLSWGGQGVVAFERSQMLSGLPANMVYFDLFPVDSNLGGMLPADLDGPVPPAGMPNPFAEIDDDAWGYSPDDQLQMWEFDVDWGTPANSTFSPLIDLGTAAFDSNMCNYSHNCIPQPGGKALDAISDRLMYRLQYRNFGTHQTLVTNHTVDATGTNRAGIRWYELRNSGGGWAIHQQSTFSPDTNHRWMSSIAMDGNGNIALGYSISSTTVFPSVRYTGRLSTDPLGTMPQGEGVIVGGGGSQSHTSGRWGDYSMMSVDPVDDCTYWYTQEYYASNSAAGWRTRIGAFGLPGCGGIPTPTASPTGPTPTATGPTPTATATGRKTATPTPTVGGPSPTAANSPTPGGRTTSSPTPTPTPGGPSPTPTLTRTTAPRRTATPTLLLPQ